MRFYISSLLFFLTSMLLANNEDSIKVNTHFTENNKKTAWSHLEKAISFVNTQPFINETKKMDIESLSSYIRTYGDAIDNLYIAAKMPCVDFSYYKHSTIPRVIDFTLKMPDCIRLLMLNYQYGVKINKPDIAYNSLLAALQIDLLLKENPYIYYQLIRAANINTIFQSIKECSAESSFNRLTVHEIDKLINLIQKEKTDIKAAWVHAFQFESLLDDKILLKTLPFYKEEKLSDKEKVLVVADYKASLKIMAEQVIKEQMDKNYLYELKKKEADINKHFSSSILDFERWVQVYAYSESQLDVIETLLQAVKFYKKNGLYPTKNDAFSKTISDTVEYFPQEKGFDLIIKDNDILSYGYIKKTSDDKTSLINLFN